jgi:hypothetical protein
MPDTLAATSEELTREVYACFGFAAYSAQCLEMSLGNYFMVYQRVSDITLTVDELLAMEATRQKQTLGLLLKDFRKYVDLDASYDDVLVQALKKRNFLMHHFFRERAVHFMADAGRSQMIDELTEIADSLQIADKVVIAVYDSLARILGVTDDVLDREFDKLHAQAKLLDSTPSPDSNV